MEQDDGLEYAGFWIRSGAFVIDTLLLAMISFPLGFMLFGQRNLTMGIFERGFFGLVVDYAIPMAITIMFWAAYQATPGKMAIRGKIVDATTGKTPTLAQYVLRYIGYFASILPLFLGILWVGFDPKKQGWHDKIANTVVVRTRQGTQPVSFSQ